MSEQTESQKFPIGITETCVALVLFGWLSFGVSIATSSVIAVIVGIVLMVPAIACLVLTAIRQKRGTV